MPDQFIRSFEATIDDVSPGERSVVAKINTDAIDRYRTVILPSGGNFEAYKRNPIVLHEHGQDPSRGTMPIGRNQWIKTSQRGIVAKTIFKDDAYSEELFKCYQEGWMRGWSLRMLNPKYSAPTREELRSRSDLSDCELVFRAWELGEYSTTYLPGNSDTLTTLASRGIWIPEEARTATSCSEGQAVKPDYKNKKKKRDADGKETEEYEDDDAVEDKKDEKRTAPYVAEEGGIWHVRNIDGTICLSFPDAGMAEECLRIMGNARTYEFAYQLQESLGDIRREAAETAQLAKEYIDLYVRGRI